MLLKMVRGDLMASAHLFDAIAHGCNSLGVMGAGIAPLFKERWPKMYQNYRKYCEDGNLNIGQCYIYEPEDETPKWVVNLITQGSHGGQIKPAEIVNIEVSLGNAVSALKEVKPNLNIAIPMIGAGLGGLQSSDVLPVYAKIVSANPGITLTVFKDFVPGLVYEG